MESTIYIPGVRNINNLEISYRKKEMIVGYVVAGILFASIMFAGWNVWMRSLIVFIPLYVGVVDNLQVYYRFCVRYGALGKQNTVNGSNCAKDVVNADARAADRQKARQISLQALAITAVLLGLSVLVPRL